MPTADKYHTNTIFGQSIFRRRLLISSLGVGIEIFWRISSDFGAKRRYWRAVGRRAGIGGDRGVWRVREDVGGGGYGEEIEGCRDSEVGGGSRVAGSRGWSGARRLEGKIELVGKGAVRGLQEGVVRVLQERWRRQWSWSAE